MIKPAGRADLFGSMGQRSVALGILITLKIALLFVLASHSRFVMDEFGQVGYAKYLGNGLFDTVWPAKAVGYAVFYKLAHVIGWDAQSILLIGRIQTALLACGILAIIYACARAVGEDRTRALLIVLILLCFSNFIERIFRTIAEPLAVFFAAAALLVVLRGKADQAWTVIAAGVLSGLAFLTTQKSVYFNLALGLGLVADAALARRYPAILKRGGWLVLGWALPIIGYCFVFGGGNPVPVAESLVFGPVEVATTGADAYANLRQYVVQTLVRNTILYAFCFAGMGLALLQVRRLDGRRRIALVFSVVITMLVFAHDQPWPYVFVMALPFMSLWSLGPLDWIAANTRHLRLAWVALAAGVGVSYANNLLYLRIDNAAQLELVKRAEALLEPNEQYFDGIGMLPNRPEPSTLWLDRYNVLRTLRKGENSEAYKIFSETPPKVILWSYRMDGIDPVVAPVIQNSYVRVAPNIRMPGRQLTLGKPARFDVPIAGTYQLYSVVGQPLNGQVEVDGDVLTAPFHLEAGSRTVNLRTGPAKALLLPAASYDGLLQVGTDNDRLFANVYD